MPERKENTHPDDSIGELSLYSPGTIEHQLQPEGGRDLSAYERESFCLIEKNWQIRQS